MAKICSKHDVLYDQSCWCCDQEKQPAEKKQKSPKQPQAEQNEEKE